MTGPAFKDVLYSQITKIFISVIGIDRYGNICIVNLSVSADIKIGLIGDYRYRPIWKKAYRSYTVLKGF